MLHVFLLDARNVHSHIFEERDRSCLMQTDRLIRPNWILVKGICSCRAYTYQKGIKAFLLKACEPHLHDRNPCARMFYLLSLC